METQTKKQILICSNGMGEDEAGAALLHLLKEQDDSIEYIAFPLLSQGKGYQKFGAKMGFKGKMPPSGGFLNSFTLVLKDFFSYALPQLFEYRQALKSYKKSTSLVIVVGDFPLLALVKSALSKTPKVMVSLFKNDYRGGHLELEKKYFDKWTKLLFVRDPLTAANLIKEGHIAQFKGNLLMETFDVPKNSKIEKTSQYVIGVVPGSRKEMLLSLPMLYGLCNDIIEKETNLSFFFAISSTIDKKELKKVLKTLGEVKEHPNGYQMEIKGTNLLFLYNSFEDMLSISDIVLGFAGSACEQAAGVGIPVLSFIPNLLAKTYFESAYTYNFLKGQEDMLGGAIKFIASDKKIILKELHFLLTSPEERKRMGDIGKKRMGEKGLAKGMATGILDLI